MNNVLRNLIGALIFGVVSFLLLGAVANASDGGVDEPWTVEMNQPSYWEARFGGEGWTCTKYENHNGWIPAQYAAAVIKDGTMVRVYQQPGPFQAQGAVNPQTGKPFRAPHSWVMKCSFSTTSTTTTVPDTTTTTAPEPTTTTTTPPETTTSTTVPETTTTTVPDVTTTSSEPPTTTSSEPSTTTTTEPEATTTTEVSPPPSTPEPPSPDPELPVTGFNLGWYALAGAVLTVGGLGLLAVRAER